MNPAKTYSMSAEARDLIQEFEGCELEAYPDPKTGGEPWTIGYGHTAGCKKGDTCTVEQANHWFDADILAFENMVREHVTAPITQGQYDAMVDIVYNVGPGGTYKDGIIRLKNGAPSTLLRKLNAKDYAGARAAYLTWVSPGSSVEAGLKRRRNAFANQFWDKP